jgi:predicted ester cyclase
VTEIGGWRSLTAHGGAIDAPGTWLSLASWRLIRTAFKARADTSNLIVADGQATLEATFVGTHIGEFAGIPPTHKEVRVPLCVVYDLANEQITRGRVYFEMPVLLQQLGAVGPSAA